MSSTEVESTPATAEVAKTTDTPATEAQPSVNADANPEPAPPAPPPKDDPPPEKKVAELKPAEGQDCGCGDDKTSNAPVNNAVPTSADLEKIAKLEVQDAEGKKYTFKSLVEAEGAENHLVIFIRHFFCGHCQEYTRALSAELSPSSLSASTRLTIIGCGSPEMINSYNKTTSNKHPLFADPTQELYKAFGFIRTLDMGQKPEYVKSSLASSVLRSIAQGLSSGKNATKGGDFKQVGGEFLFTKPVSGGEGTSMWPATWGHRMRSTRDHTEIKELKSVLGIPTESNGVNGAAKTENKPRRSSTFFGRKDQEAKKEKNEDKGKEKAVEPAATAP